MLLPDAEGALHGGEHEVVGEVVRGELGHPPRQLVLIPPDMYCDLTRAANNQSVFTITEKAPTTAFS